jgi:integrase
MPRTLNRLSPIKVQKSKRKGLHADGGGLYLRISASGSKAWIFRYGENGRLHDMGLGPVHTVSLPRARELARECRELRLQGHDPIAHRRAALAARKASDAKAMTFHQAADAYIASHEAAWRNAEHRRQWGSTLDQHVHPTIGTLAVAAIDTALVMKVVDPIWREIPETASRVRGRIESVLDWAKARGFRTGENPARWRGHLDHLLPARRKMRQVEHLAAMPYVEVPAFLADLRRQEGIAARALEFAILTAARTGEVMGATWSEITGDVWIIPASRMKGAREHRVPLAPAALAILRGLPRQSDYVFSGPRGRLGKKAIAKALRRDDVTVHGFRSAFSDWAAHETNYPNHVVEQALAHAVGSAVERAYRRGDLFDKRRELMQAWGTYCSCGPK